MQHIEIEQITARLKRDNPWWETGEIQKFNRDYGPPRVYLAGFLKLLQADVRRAVVLMGPRRVGKTVMIHHAIQVLLDGGVDPKTILYVPIDIPTYLGLSLERLLEIHRNLHGIAEDAKVYAIFDEIQYLKDWERHLKTLVDTYPYSRFVASGSAAAALRMKSIESGAGRFTDYLLPPLAFCEFAVGRLEMDEYGRPYSIDDCNRVFIDYLNFGGFPEAANNPTVQDAFEQYVASDILDKVLLNDIPSLYGVGNTHDLKRLFTVLAYNTGHEIGYEDLSRDSGIAKNTLRKYIEYLEAAFLIHRLPRIDQTARRLKRETHFKVYLTNPCLRAALFGPVTENDSAMGSLAETALMSQWVQRPDFDCVYYCRWKDGEVDFVWLSPGSLKIEEVIEIKWSDRAVKNPIAELKGPLKFAMDHDVDGLTVTTKTKFGMSNVGNIGIGFGPTSMFVLSESFLLKKLIDENDPRRWLGDSEQEK